MKIIKVLKNISILAVMGFSSSSFAYNAGNTQSSCKVPKFTSLTPGMRHKGDPVPEVAAESEIEFTVSGYADPTSIVAVAKNEPLKLNVVNRNSFHQVTAKLPAVLNGKYARIHVKAVSATTPNGDCTGKGGWLIKINKAVEPSEVIKEAVEEPEVESVEVL
ncbi:MAG: hypothetical protein KAG26_07425 [Methylococcales bacterium]|nr:hypothetical protein [Methylococcales bacterium]